MKKLPLILLCLWLAAVAARAADTVELLPGKIVGTVRLSSEVLNSGQVYANSTDGSASASASFQGENYSIVVPGGKTWRLSFYLYPRNGNVYSYLYVNPDTQVGVAANAEVTQNYTLASARITAAVQVANGTLASFANLQASGRLGNVNFNAYSQGSDFVTALTYTGVTVQGVANLTSSDGLGSSVTLAAKTVDVAATGVTASWSVDAGFQAGAVQGSVALSGAATPTSASVYLYGPKNTSANLTGNGSYQFAGLVPGDYSVYGYTYYPSAQLQFYRAAKVAAGAVTTVNFGGVLTPVSQAIQFTGFLTAAKLNGGSINANMRDNSNTNANASLKSTGGFTLFLTPGPWAVPNLSLSTYNSADNSYLSLSRYDYQRANNPITVAEGTATQLPDLVINTTQTELIFDVIEAPGATAQTPISGARVSGSTVTYNAAGQPLLNLSFNAGNNGPAQAKPSVKIIGEPGVYNVQAFGTVDGSNVSFGSFRLELKAPLLTPVGTDVVVSPDANVTLTFDAVTAAGVTTSSTLPVGPQLPPGYSALTVNGEKSFYSESTTATVSGFVDIAIKYNAAGLTPAQEAALQVLYYDAPTQKWINVTTGVNAAADTAYGTAPGLSIFVLALKNAPTLNPVAVPANPLKGTAVTFTATYADADAGDTHTAVWTWGDGTPATAGTLSAGTVSGTHTYAAAGTYTGSLTITDATGGTATRPFTVTVGGGDTTAPVLTLASSVTAEATSAAGAAVTFAVAANDDTDGVVAVSLSHPSGSVFPLGDTVVTATARDAAGNTATQTFTVSVRDTVKPVITVPGLSPVEATSAAGAVVGFEVTADDRVSGAVAVVATPASGSTFPIGTTQVTLTATDAAGNLATTTLAVTVADTTAPAIAPLANLTVEAAGADGAAATFAPTATDAVSTPVVTTSAASGSVFPVGTTPVTVTAKDAAGNTSTRTFTVTVRDSTAPALAPLANLTAEATGAAGAAVTFAPAATDAVSTPVITTSAASGSVFPVGTTTVNVIARDAAGNAATGSFTVTVRDSTAPVLTVPAAIVAEATGPNGAAVTYAATATDAVGATVTASAVSGSVFPVGTTTVNVTARDAAGNAATGSFTVTVRDSTAPVLTVPTAIIAEATGPNGAAVTYAATAADAVGATVTASHASGSVFPVGTTTVTVNARDAAGNAAAPRTFTVTVRDTAGPVLALPVNLVVEATDDDETRVTFVASATDLVSGVRPLILSRSSGSKFPLGVTTVTATAKDALGNTSSGSFTVTVRDTTAPTLKLPKNLVVDATGAAGATVRYEVEADDAVSSDKRIKLTYSKASGTTFPLGITTVTVTATDEAGNVRTGTFTVTVRDRTRPVFTKLSVTPSRILTNDRAMVPVTVTATATDRVDPTLSVRIVSVTSDEPVTGTSAGDVGPDWEITGPLTLKLRAERDPKANGRIYTIAVAATDDSGNTVTRTLHVLVAKNASVRFEDCDDKRRSEAERCKDEDRDHDARDQGDRDEDDDDDNDRRARGK